MMHRKKRLRYERQSTVIRVVVLRHQHRDDRRQGVSGARIAATRRRRRQRFVVRGACAGRGGVRRCVIVERLRRRVSEWRWSGGRRGSGRGRRAAQSVAPLLLLRATRHLYLWIVFQTLGFVAATALFVVVARIVDFIIIRIFIIVVFVISYVIGCWWWCCSS